MKELKGLYMTAFIIVLFAATLMWRMTAYAAPEGFQPTIGKPGDGGFIHFVGDQEMNLEGVSIQVSQITEGEEITRLTENLDGAARIFEYKLMKDGEEMRPDTRMTIGFDLPDTMVGFYAKVYRIEKDGQLTELLYNNTYYDFGIVGGLDYWQYFGVTDYTIGRYLVVAPYAFGDVNGDNEISADDALEVLRMVVRLRGCSGDNLWLTADATGDDIIDAKDALEILRYTVKSESRISAWDRRIPQ